MARRGHRPPARDARQELIDLALDLDLTALAQAFPEILARAEQERTSFTAFSLALLRAEWGARRDRSLQRILKRSRLGTVQGLEGYDFAIRPKLDARIVKELLDCRFLEERRNILCLGGPGTGKTRVVKTIARAARALGDTVLYVVMIEMLEALHASRADNTFSRAFRRLVKPQLLVIDEFAHDPIGMDATKDLFRLVSARYQQSSIILAANTGFKKWNKLFPTEAAAVATVDRLVDKATILRFTGKGGREPKEIIGAPLEGE
jgi:DNA replication protein DnaC